MLHQAPPSTSRVATPRAVMALAFESTGALVL